MTNIDNIAGPNQDPNQGGLSRRALIAGALGAGIAAIVASRIGGESAVPSVDAGAPCDPNLGDVCTGDVVVDPQTGSTFETGVIFKPKGEDTTTTSTTEKPHDSTTTSTTEKPHDSTTTSTTEKPVESTTTTTTIPGTPSKEVPKAD